MKINKKIAEKALTSQVEEKIENLINTDGGRVFAPLAHCQKHVNFRFH